ncbi:MAG: hypothetical protein J3R72DRAFT_436118 [Linnemannia gamsii]|nr:MAG: hypothetical protein J3R72DRAFT_436118 [Linnemannia gamsii]
MSSAFPLPLECLQLIIRHLRNHFALKSIASLLRVNQYVCAAALPILYEDPFVEMYAYSTGDDDLDSQMQPFLRLKRLLRVLLCSLPINTSAASDHRLQEGEIVTELLRAAYFQEQDQVHKDGDDHVEMKWGLKDTTGQDEDGTPAAPLLPHQPTTLLPYYSFLANVTFEDQNHASECLQSRPFFLNQPAVLEYLQQTGERDRYLAQEPYRSFPWMTQEEGDKILVSQATKRRLQQDITWAMCFSNAEHIRTLQVSIADIGRYLVLAPRFKVLSGVDFQLDRSLTVHLQLGHELTPGEEEVLARLKKERTKNLEDAILFVQEHQRHNPNVIRTAQYLDNHAYPDFCPKEYQFRLLQTLPPLNQPRILDTNTWAQFAAKIADTDLSYVKGIFTEHMSSDAMYLSHILAQDPFLHRCRSLERMDIASFGEDIFKWAVQERKEFDRNNGYSASPSSSCLVPLRAYQVRYNEPSYGRQINDVAYAFGNTLETLVIDGYYSENHLVLQQDQPDFSLGRSRGVEDNNDDIPPSWPELPRLRTLRAETHHISLRLHRRLFSQLPHLRELSLGDKRSQYSLTDVVHWEPAKMLELGYLTLTGTPAICFHPDTFKSTRNLVTLSLRMVETGESSYIPDPEQFEEEGQETSESHSDDTNSLLTPFSLQTRRPVWTWDWDLPKLTHLILKSEFAYRFQFRMLTGTPNLAYISLNINSLTMKHRRTVGIADFVKPGFQHPALACVLDREQEQQEERKGIPHWDSNVHHSGEAKEGEDDEIWQEFEFLHLPDLKFFTLLGVWMFDHRALNVLFNKVAPQIETIYMHGSYGFTISELVQSTSLHLHNLSNCVTSIQPFPRLVAEAGLVEHEVFHEDENGSRVRSAFKLAVQPVGRAKETHATYQFL